MKKILSLFLSVSLIFASVTPSRAQEPSVRADIDPLSVWGDLMKSSDSVDMLSSREITEVKEELNSFIEALGADNSSLETQDAYALFKESYLQEVANVRVTFEENFGTPLPKAVLKELKELEKDSSIEEAWQEQEQALSSEFGRIGQLLFRLYDMPGEKSTALEYMYRIFPLIYYGLDNPLRERGLQIMRRLVLENASSCANVGTWTSIKAFFGNDADLNDAQTKCQQALAAVQLLPVFGDFSSSSSEDVKAAATLFAWGFNGSSALLLIQTVGAILLETGRTDALANVLLAVTKDGGADYGLLFAQYTPDFSSVASYISNKGDGFSIGYEYSYYASPVQRNSNQRNVWADLGRVWGKSSDLYLARVLDAAVKSTNPDDVLFKPFVAGVLSSGYIYKNPAFTQELAKNLFFMEKGDLNPYTATYMENLLAYGYHLAGGVDVGYNAMAAKYKSVPPLTQDNYFTCPSSIDVPTEELPERVICQWTQPSTGKLVAQQRQALLYTAGAILDGLTMFISCGMIGGSMIYKLLAGAGRIMGQGTKWANSAVNLYRKASIAWYRSKLIQGARKIQRAAVAGMTTGFVTLQWRLVKPTKKLLKIMSHPQAYRRSKNIQRLTGNGTDIAVDLAQVRFERRNIPFAIEEMYHLVPAETLARLEHRMGGSPSSWEEQLTMLLQLDDREFGHLFKQILPQGLPTSQGVFPLEETLFGYSWAIKQVRKFSDKQLGGQAKQLLKRLQFDADYRVLLNNAFAVRLDVVDSRLVWMVERRPNQLGAHFFEGLSGLNSPFEQLLDQHLIDSLVFDFKQGNRPVFNVDTIEGFFSGKGYRVQKNSDGSLAVFNAENRECFQVMRKGNNIQKPFEVFVLRDPVTGRSELDAFMKESGNGFSFQMTRYESRGTAVSNGITKAKDAVNFNRIHAFAEKSHIRLTPGETDASNLLAELRDFEVKNRALINERIKSSVPSGHSYHIRRTLRFTEHEAGGGKSGKLHMHIEVDMPEVDMRWNFSIPVQGTDPQARALLDYYNSGTAVFPWIGERPNAFTIDAVMPLERKSAQWAGSIMDVISVPFRNPLRSAIAINSADRILDEMLLSEEDFPKGKQQQEDTVLDDSYQELLPDAAAGHSSLAY